MHRRRHGAEGHRHGASAGGCFGFARPVPGRGGAVDRCASVRLSSVARGIQRAEDRPGEAAEGGRAVARGRACSDARGADFKTGCLGKLPSPRPPPSAHRASQSHVPGLGSSRPDHHRGPEPPSSSLAARVRTATARASMRSRGPNLLTERSPTACARRGWPSRAGAGTTTPSAITRPRATGP